MEDVLIREGAFMCLPVKWIFELSGEELKKMAILHWRFSYFADMALKEGKDIKRCYYESQQKMAILFGMSTSSRTKVGKFLTKMEDEGYLSIIKESTTEEGRIKPRHYIVVNDPRLLEKYKLERTTHGKLENDSRLEPHWSDRWTQEG